MFKKNSNNNCITVRINTEHLLLTFYLQTFLEFTFKSYETFANIVFFMNSRKIRKNVQQQPKFSH